MLFISQARCTPSWFFIHVKTWLIDYGLGVLLRTLKIWIHKSHVTFTYTTSMLSSSDIWIHGLKQTIAHVQQPSTNKDVSVLDLALTHPTMKTFSYEFQRSPLTTYFFSLQCIGLFLSVSHWCNLNLGVISMVYSSFQLTGHKADFFWHRPTRAVLRVVI